MPHFQVSLAEIGPLPGRPTRRTEFFERLDQLAPWGRCVATVEPHRPHPEGAGRRPVGAEVMLSPCTAKKDPKVIAKTDYRALSTG